MIMARAVAAESGMHHTSVGNVVHCENSQDINQREAEVHLTWVERTRGVQYTCYPLCKTRWRQNDNFGAV